MEWIKYTNIRNSIVTGDVYFVRASTIFGKIVNLFTSSDIPHTGMFVVLAGRVFCVEINIFGRVSMYLASEFLKDKQIYFVKTNTKVRIDDVLKDLGVIKYNYVGVIVAPFIRLRTTRKDCAEWLAEKLGLKFEHLNRGIYPSDIMSVFCDQKE